MRTGLLIIVLLVCLAGLTAGVSAAATDSAVAGWVWIKTPGTDAVFQTPGSTTGLVYTAWGPDCTINSGQMTWVHFPVPVIQNQSEFAYARFITVRFYAGSADVGVSQIHVWDGVTKVKAFTGSWNGPGYRTVTLDLGTNYRFRYGMTIAMNVGAGVESMNHRFYPVSGGGKFFIPP